MRAWVVAVVVVLAMVGVVLVAAAAAAGAAAAGAAAVGAAATTAGVATTTAGVTTNGTQAHRSRPSGPGLQPFACDDQWAPIQAKVSGFVVGNCRGGTPVLGIARDECAPGCLRGSPSEGRGWEAVSFPLTAHFAGCGWVNLTNRLRPHKALDGAPMRNRCGVLAGPDFAGLSAYVKTDSGRRIAGAPRPATVKYHGRYLWSGRFTSGPHRGEEGGAVKYRPRFRSDPSKTCTAYANVNPWLAGQRVRSTERMWAVHDRSRHLQIRYIARFRAENERGELRWWVNAHSTDPADRGQPWGFVAAECIFDQPTASGAAARQQRRRPAAAKCGFTPAAFHTILERSHMSCEGAKSILRQLRANHDLAPMACTDPRRVNGWHLRNLAHDSSLGITHYSRGRRSFTFQRHQFPGNIWCPGRRR